MHPAARREPVQETRECRRRSAPRCVTTLAQTAPARYDSRPRNACRHRCDSGRVAQLVEQGIENPRVGGSIPSSATICKPSFARLYGYYRIDFFSLVLLDCARYTPFRVGGFLRHVRSLVLVAQVCMVSRLASAAVVQPAKRGRFSTRSSNARSDTCAHDA